MALLSAYINSDTFLPSRALLDQCYEHLNVLSDDTVLVSVLHCVSCRQMPMVSQNITVHRAAFHHALDSGCQIYRTGK